jgi:hypothetical protein
MHWLIDNMIELSNENVLFQLYSICEGICKRQEHPNLGMTFLDYSISPECIYSTTQRTFTFERKEIDR